MNGLVNAMMEIEAEEARKQIGKDAQPTVPNHADARAQCINKFCEDLHKANHRWWHDLKTGERLNRNKGEMLMLMVSEISEAMEGERKDLMDDHLPNRRMAEVELADAIIRIFDYAGAHGYDLGGAFVEKLAYNETRADHSAEARLAPNGKKW